MRKIEPVRNTEEDANAVTPRERAFLKRALIIFAIVEALVLIPVILKIIYR